MKLGEKLSRYLSGHAGPQDSAIPGGYPDLAQPPAHGRAISKGTELPERLDDWPLPWREDYEERAAIMEYCAGMVRDQAENLAERCVRATALRARSEGPVLGTLCLTPKTGEEPPGYRPAFPGERAAPLPRNAASKGPSRVPHWSKNPHGQMNPIHEEDAC